MWYNGREMEAGCVYLDFDCPLELRGYELLHDDRGKVRAYLRLMNLAGRRVADFEAVIAWYGDGGECKKMPFTADQLRASARAEFTLSLSTDQCPQAKHVEIRFARIRFEDGSPDWTGEEADMRRIELPEPPDGKSLNALVAAAGADARYFPEKHADYWLCVCGRPNPRGAEQCARCRRGRDVVLKNLTRKSVLSDAPPVLPGLLSPEPMPEPDLSLFARPAPPASAGERVRARAALEEDALRKKFLRQRSLILRRTVTMLVIAALIALIGLAIPYLKYQQQRAREIVPPVKAQVTAAPADPSINSPT